MKVNKRKEKSKLSNKFNKKWLVVVTSLLLVISLILSACSNYNDNPTGHHNYDINNFRNSYHSSYLRNHFHNGTYIRDNYHQYNYQPDDNIHANYYYSATNRATKWSWRNFPSTSIHQMV